MVLELVPREIFIGKKIGFAKLAHQRPRHCRPRRRSKRQDHEQQAEEHHRLQEAKKRESISFQIILNVLDKIEYGATELAPPRAL